MAGKKPGRIRMHEDLGSNWWVDVGENAKIKVKSAASERLNDMFKAADGFEQETARDRLTDNNWKLVAQAEPPEGGWSYIQLAPTKFPEKELAKIKRLVDLPDYARGVILDSGERFAY